MTMLPVFTQKHGKCIPTPSNAQCGVIVILNIELSIKIKAFMREFDMKILITAANQFTGASLKIGCYYSVEPFDDSGTSEQNRAFHALISEYWRSGTHSYNAKNFQHFRELIKLYLGAGAEKYFSLVDSEGKPTEPKVSWRVKSWANYSKKERTETIDRLIAEMVQAGADSKKFHEIIDGMERKSVGGVPA